MTSLLFFTLDWFIFLPQLEKLPLALVLGHGHGSLLLHWRFRTRSSIASSCLRFVDGGAALSAFEDGLGSFCSIHLSRHSFFSKFRNILAQREGGIVSGFPSLQTKLSTTHDLDRHAGLFVLIDGHFPDGPNDIHPIDDLTEDNVLPVESRASLEGDEELGSVGVAAPVRHGEHSGLCVPSREILVVKGSAIDALATVAVVELEIATLDHEVLH
mmetsp:Transcript_47270/g.101771  ORF Transcript_47270/g.101771 Transcript_47270/m.101771 type:complete len:214 (+) Transcript_47270:707-1348(+)